MHHNPPPPRGIVGLAREIFNLNKPKIKFRKNSRYDKPVCVKAMRQNADKIEQVFSLLEDERSKEIYRLELLSRKKSKNMMPSVYVEPVCDQYFDREIIRFEEKEIFIDAGAYDGATTALFLQYASNSFAKAYLLEPDAAMYQAMLEKMAPLNDGNLEFIKAGLYDKSGTAKFESRPIGSSNINTEGTEEINTVALDDLVDEATFIKMDIEGAELKALMGARNIIQKNKPKLAISIYHNIDDLWMVPLLIHSINPAYKLYVRKYEGAAGYFLNEVVCYAI